MKNKTKNPRCSCKHCMWADKCPDVGTQDCEDYTDYRDEAGEKTCVNNCGEQKVYKRLWQSYVESYE